MMVLEGCVGLVVCLAGFANGVKVAVSSSVELVVIFCALAEPVKD